MKPLSTSVLSSVYSLRAWVRLRHHGFPERVHISVPHNACRTPTPSLSARMRRWERN